MSEVITHVGIDAHRKDLFVAMLIGRESGRRVRLGDAVEVRVRSIHAPRGRVDLEPV